MFPAFKKFRVPLTMAFPDFTSRLCDGVVLLIPRLPTTSMAVVPICNTIEF